MHVGQAEISPGVTEGELLVVKTHQVQDGRVQIVNVDSVLDGVVTVVVCRTEMNSRFESTSRHPPGEAVRIMVAAVFAFRCWRPPELASP